VRRPTVTYQKHSNLYSLAALLRFGSCAFNNCPVGDLGVGKHGYQMMQDAVYRYGKHNKYHTWTVQSGCASSLQYEENTSARLHQQYKGFDELPRVS
jgi:hypothetical protein